MFNIGAAELVVIFVVALLLLGPEKLPELARGIGKFMREFRRQTDDVRGMVEREFYQMDQEIREEPSRPEKTVHSIAPPALPPSVEGPISQEAASQAPLSPATQQEELVDPDGTQPDPTALAEPPTQPPQPEQKPQV